MTYGEVSEKIEPLKKRIEEVRWRLSETHIQLAKSVRTPSAINMNEDFLSHKDDFAIFQEYQQKLIDRLSELETELEEFLKTVVK